MSYIQAIGYSIFWILIIYILYRSVRRLRPRTITTVISFQSGYQYGCTIGDAMYAYPGYGNYNGLDVRLPIELPHIYLDSLRAGGKHVSAIFDNNQSIALEGSFSTDFNVFVPRYYEAVALSVLTPDVMETLQRYATNFDVELYGSHLRIISNRTVLRNAPLQADMLAVAEKVLVEIEQRGRNWSQQNSADSLDQDLRIKLSAGRRVFGHYIAWSSIRLLVWWLSCTISIGLLGIWAITQDQIFLGSCLIIGAVIATIGLQLFSLHKQRSSSFWSRKG